MIQFLMSFLPVAAIIITIYMLASSFRKSGRRLGKLLDDFDWCLANSPAQVAFFMFSFTVAVAAGILAGNFSQISTLWILTLDILFLFSSLLLILFHRIKVYPTASL